jgi:hypothetical protein
MNHSRVPVVAAWMLEHFGSDPMNENVMGDLAEQFAHGRTRAWYWRQALRAIVVSFFKEIRRHKVRALCAITLGWFVLLSWRLSVPKLMHLMSTGDGRFERDNYFIIVGNLLVIAATGWIVARIARDVRTSAVLGFSASYFAYGIVTSMATFLWLTGNLVPFGARLAFLMINISLSGLLAMLILKCGGLLNSSPAGQSQIPQRH